jgi:ketosteroid isomerase-like protein
MVDKVAIAAQYMKARLAEDKQTLLGLVSDDVTLISSRDGTHQGKEAFAKYLEAVKPTGKWEDPVLEGDQVVVKGSVTILFIPWSVASYFTFNEEGKITKIEIKRV